jgi:hypothetical protein
MSIASGDSAQTMDVSSLDIILSESRGKLDAQERQIDALDTKAGVFIGLDTVVLTIMAGATEAHGILLWIRLLVYVALFASVVCLVRGLSVRVWKFPPNPRKFLDSCRFQPAQESKALLAESIADAYAANATQLVHKTRWMQAGLALVVVAVLMYAALLLASATISR